MKCANCGKNVNAGSKFCPNCGEKTVEKETGMKIEDITIQWIGSILQKLEYEPEYQEDDEDTVIGRNDERLSVFLSLKKDLKIISQMQHIQLSKPNWGKKNDFLTTLNNANSEGTFCTYFFDEDILSIYSFFQITESVSEHDLLYFMESARDEMIQTVNDTGLINYLN